MGEIVKNKKVRKGTKPAKKGSTKYSDLPDLSKDPYFVKKAEDAHVLLVKTGILRD
jgi:hypothetical protein